MSFNLLANIKRLRPRNIRTLATAPKFTYMRECTNGMLSPLVYKKIYTEAKKLPDYPYVEIGAASGTGTISLAWAYKDTDKHSKIIAIEKCQGGSRTDYGNFDDNQNILKNNLTRFGVSDRVNLYMDTLNQDDSDKINLLMESEIISGFMHDADGRLDRDFSLFWEKTIPGGLIIIDDYDNKPEYKGISERCPDGGKKFVMTYRLLNLFIKYRFFEPKVQLNNTVFGIKPLAAKATELPLNEINAIFSEKNREWKI